MILIVNLNLAVDVIVDLDGLQLNWAHRARSTLRQGGGKGVNAARVLKTLGESCIVAGFLGGRSGEFIGASLRAEGIASSCTPIRNESRTCLILNDRVAREQTVINESGAEISDDEWAQFSLTYERLLRDSALVLITGSLPRGLPVDAYAHLIRAANKQGKSVLLDSSSDALRASLCAAPFIVKINEAEAGELLGKTVECDADVAEATDKLLELGAQNALITRGAKGAIFNFENVKYRSTPPPIEAENSVGSGDAVLAGLASGLRRKLSPEQAGALAVAAGTANALHGFGRCSAEEIDEVLRKVALHKMY
ncbi:MAG: 1-phosphofructokinase family hexose kinase [Pyrinomonadaceae bacterium]|nr:1-phosphofructokinase family hexose kinase [Pyrinomonadaceae bacterium]